MKLPVVLFALALRMFTTAFVQAQTTVPEGTVSGTWISSGSPYLIMGEITVPVGKTLTIEPGVEVIFQGHYKLIVRGVLLASGSENDSIKFTINDTTGFYDTGIPDGGWHGLRFVNSAKESDSSEISYCTFTFGKAEGVSDADKNGGAISVNCYPGLTISNSYFSDCIAAREGGAVAIKNADILLCNNNFYNNNAKVGGALAVHCSDIHISRNVFWENKARNSGGAITVNDNSDGDITANMMAYNEAGYGGALQIKTDCDPVIRNNLIYANVAYEKGGGADLEDNCQATFVNNTITENSAGFGGGIDCEDFSSPVFHNNILWNNTASNDGDQIHLSSEDSDPDFYYCDIQGGMDEIGAYDDGGTYEYTGIYDQNTNIEPGFTEPENDIFLLSYKSPCIDDGDPDVLYNDVEDPDVPGFALWPSKGTVRNDMGAYGGAYAFFLQVVTGIKNPDISVSENYPCILYQNSPNPVKGKTWIRYQLLKTGHVVLSVYDLTGKELLRPVDQQQSKGAHHIEVDINKYILRKGIYIYSLKVDKYTVSRKMIVY